jgi:hypothetical protein
MIDLNHLIQSIGDTVNNLISSKSATSSTTSTPVNIQQVTEEVKEGTQIAINIFSKINLWFKTNIGVSIVEILKAIGRAVLWILEKIVELLKRVVE